MSNVFILANQAGAMSASGTGEVETVVHTNATHSGVEYEFRIDLPVTHNLFKSIGWADRNTEGAVDAGSGVAAFDISMNKQMFRDALVTVINDASGGPIDDTVSTDVYETDATGARVPATLAALPSNLGNATPTARTIIDREVRLEVERLLNTNGVLEYLEGDSLGKFSLYLDASAGAWDMAGKLGDISGNLRNFFLQIPNRDYATVAGAPYTATDSAGTLPVMVGDTIGFVFDIDTTVSITEADTTNAGAVGTTNPAVSNPLGAVIGNNLPFDYFDSTSAGYDTTLTTGARRVIFIVKAV